MRKEGQREGPGESGAAAAAAATAAAEEEEEEAYELPEPEPEELENVFPPLPDYAAAARGPRAAEVKELRESLQEAFRVPALPTARFDAAGAELMRFAAAAGVSCEKRKGAGRAPSTLSEEAEADAKAEGGGGDDGDDDGGGGGSNSPETPTTPGPAGRTDPGVAVAR